MHTRKPNRVSEGSKVLALELRAATRLCEGIGSPRALAVYLLIKHKEYRQLLEMDINPSHYVDKSRFEDDYLVTSVLKKNPRIEAGFDKAGNALSAFFKSEQQCAASNDRLSDLLNGHIDRPDLLPVLNKAQEWIGRILGVLSRRKLAYCEEMMGFGPGATTSVSGVVTQGKKYSSRVIDCTPRCLDFGLFATPLLWRRTIEGFNLQVANKFTTVPKNAKTDRGICIEPDLNIFIQKGQGALLKRQLSAFGLDIYTQDSNRYLASKAQQSGLATVDFSRASDTVCRNAVWFLLPFEWADFLHYSRVDNTMVDGKIVPLEKWSSMGNGYTFELETLIFYGLALAAVELTAPEKLGDVATFGDDVILAQEALGLFREASTFLGFEVNDEKSFGSGRFFESCGTDYFDGHDVRPFYFRSDNHDFPTICYIYANAIRRWSHRRNNGGSCDIRCLSAWLVCFTACPDQHRYRIPTGWAPTDNSEAGKPDFGNGYGDVGFISNFDEAVPRLSREGRDRGWSGYSIEYRLIRMRSARISEEGCLTAFLNGNRTDFSLGRESLRGRPSRPTVEVGHALAWPNLGPWRPHILRRVSDFVWLNARI
jgi:hypothetical protein